MKWHIGLCLRILGKPNNLVARRLTQLLPSTRRIHWNVRRVDTSNLSGFGNNMDRSVVMRKLNEFIPLNLAESWDNVGLLVEPPNSINLVSKILLTNDVTLSVMDEAENEKADFIISYHPPLFQPIKRFTASGWKEQIIGRCIKSGISLYSPHTCCDALYGGVNDWLIKGFGDGTVKPISLSRKGSRRHLITLQIGKHEENRAKDTMQINLISEFSDIEINNVTEDRIEIFCDEKVQEILMARLLSDYSSIITEYSNVKLEQDPIPNTGMGRLLHCDVPITIEEAVNRVKKHLDLGHLRLALKYGGAKDNKIKRIAVCAGAGVSVLRLVKADLYLTGEMGHHDVLEFTQNGSSVILTDHSNSERGYLDQALRPALNDLFEGAVQIIVSKNDAEPLKVV